MFIGDHCFQYPELPVPPRGRDAVAGASDQLSRWCMACRLLMTWCQRFLR